MFKLASIEVEGFRDQVSQIALDLKGDANFIIGRNGTGKTTLINLIHAALVADVAVLREYRFKSITMRFIAEGTRARPKVFLKKGDEEFSDNIFYQVYESAKSAHQDFALSRFRRRVVMAPDGQRRMMNLSGPVSGSAKALREKLSAIYRTTWLSLRREDEEPEEGELELEEGNTDTDVDRKLERVFNDLVKYFSRLDRQVSEQTQSFQKHWFLSFLAQERSFKKRELDKINLEEERSALTAIFEEFNMTQDTYENQLDSHLEIADRVRRVLGSDDPMPIEDYLAVFDVTRLHSLVVLWEKLQIAQKKTYLPKSEFIDIASNMLFRKSISVDSSNQVIIVSDIGGNVPVKKLSSGEKQLLIFLSETLLQEQSPYIFLADEPELSLHVEWQEELVPNLLRINPNAQVIFATHSPDIVSSFQKALFRMEDLVK